MDQFVKVCCNTRTANTLQKLRRELNSVLHYKYAHPGVTNWDDDNGHFLKTIISVITSDDATRPLDDLHVADTSADAHHDDSDDSDTSTATNASLASFANTDNY
jgi:hypothetical protein